MNDDPERLVSEALRAHAARTPLPEPQRVDFTNQNVNPNVGGYGLLAGGPAPQSVDPPTLRAFAPRAATSRIEPRRSVAAGWILLLAVLLGLASGAVVGLLTLL